MKSGLPLALLACIFASACTPALAQDWARAKLEKSPRHSEWVTVKNGSREVKCFVSYPENKNKATAVLVIHEIFGLSDWVRLVADDLAAEGFIAIAPDLLSGLGPNKAGTADFGGDDGARKAVSQLAPEQVTADLKAVADHLSKIPAGNGKFAVAGFCWGGSQTFRFATNCGAMKASHVFYGSGPVLEEELSRIKSPIYGYYAQNDARVNATLDKTSQSMKKLNKAYDPEVYPGAGHGFMRAGQAPDASQSNKAAREAAWERLTKALKGL